MRFITAGLALGLCALMMPATSAHAPLSSAYDTVDMMKGSDSDLKMQNIPEIPDLNRPVSIIGDTCPTVTSVPPEVAERYDIDTTFYTKYVEALGGLPVISSSQVSDAAVLQMAMNVNWMLAEREEYAIYMADLKLKVGILARVEVTVDIPEYGHMDPDVWNWARGLGAVCNNLIVTAAEENLLCDYNDNYNDNFISYHEFSHAVHEMAVATVTPELFSRTVSEWKKARDTIPAYDGQYSGSNENECHAESAVSYFGGKHSASGKYGSDSWLSDELKEKNPSMFQLMEEIYPRGGRPLVAECPTESKTWTLSEGEPIILDCTDFWKGNAKRDMETTPYDDRATCGLPAACHAPENTAALLSGDWSACPDISSECATALEHTCTKAQSSPICRAFYLCQSPSVCHNHLNRGFFMDEWCHDITPECDAALETRCEEGDHGILSLSCNGRDNCDAGSDTCHDNYHSCPSWTLGNSKCTAQTDVGDRMRRNCPLSCGLCSLVPTTEPTTTEPSTEPTTTEPTTETTTETTTAPSQCDCGGGCANHFDVGFCDASGGGGCHYSYEAVPEGFCQFMGEVANPTTVSPTTTSPSNGCECFDNCLTDVAEGYCRPSAPGGCYYGPYFEGVSGADWCQYSSPGLTGHRRALLDDSLEKDAGDSGAASFIFAATVVAVAGVALSVARKRRQSSPVADDASAKV